MNPLARLSTLAPKSAGLKLVTHIATGDMPWLERFLHRAFAHRRVKLEWFRLTDDEVTLIEAIPAADTIDDMPSAVAALYGLNEHNGFRWGKQDDGAGIPQRVKGIQFYTSAAVANALQRWIASRPFSSRPTKRVLLEGLIIEFLKREGAWPPKDDDKT